MTLSIDAQILKKLRAAQAHVSAAELGATAPSISELREAGYEIEEHPHFGYRLVSAPDRLIADDLAGMLEGCALARKIFVFEKTSSTNDVVAQLGRSGAAEGTVVFAETQTAGRGRLGRKWESAAREGLWFSVLLRPRVPVGEWTRLTTFAAVAVAQGLEEVVGARAAIKWPNDIFLAGKKAVGILIESHAGGNPFAVLGTGVNVNQTHFPTSLAARAVSLREIAGRALDRQHVAAILLRKLDALYPRLGEGFSEILAEAEGRSFLRGRWVEAEQDGACVRGVAEALDENGALLLRKSDGTLVALASGEVSLARI